MHRFLTALYCDVRRMLPLKSLFAVMFTSMLYVSMQPYVHLPSASIEYVYLGLVGGFGYVEIISLELDNLFIWTLTMLSFLLCISSSMQEEYSGRCKDTLHRFSSYRRWYMSKAIASIIACIVIGLIISFGVVLGSLVWGVKEVGVQLINNEGVLIPAWLYCLIALGLMLSNAIMLSQWQMTIHLLTNNIVITTIAYIFPVVVGLYSASNTYLSLKPLKNPINWGMLLRSELMSNPGYDLLTAVVGQFGIALVCFLVGYFFSARVNLACRCKYEE